MPPLNITEKDHGVTFVVKVAPRASRAAIEGLELDALKVRLTAPPVEGAANQALIKLLAKALGLAPGRLAIVGGEHARRKLVRAEGLTAAELLARLGLAG